MFKFNGNERQFNSILTQIVKRKERLSKSIKYNIVRHTLRLWDFQPLTIEVKIDTLK
jgi:hypothetical protein